MLKMLGVENGLQKCIVLNGADLFMLGARLRKAYFSLQAVAPRAHWASKDDRYLPKEGANFPFSEERLKQWALRCGRSCYDCDAGLGVASTWKDERATIRCPELLLLTVPTCTYICGAISTPLFQNSPVGVRCSRRPFVHVIAPTPDFSASYIHWYRRMLLGSPRCDFLDEFHHPTCKRQDEFCVKMVLASGSWQTNTPGLYGVLVLSQKTAFAAPQ